MATAAEADQPDWFDCEDGDLAPEGLSDGACEEDLPRPGQAFAAAPQQADAAARPVPGVGVAGASFEVPGSETAAQGPLP
eukprot:6701402-Alexandrium_andersonii.AAC.1